MKRVAILIFFLLPLFGSWKIISQTVRRPISSPYLGFGAYSNHHLDVFSFESNQAALAKLNHASAGIYGEKRFFLKELSFYDVAAVIPTRSGNFGLDARYYGFADYNETQLGLAYGRNLGSQIDVGAQFNYYGVRIAGYGNASTINFEAGAILHLTDKLNAGLHTYNPIGSRLGKNEEEKLASLYSVAAGYEASEKFFFNIEIEKEEDKPVNVNAGLQYKFLPQLLARGGVSCATSSMYLGIGFELKSMRLDATASYHPQLGITPGLMLLVPLSRKGGFKKDGN
ncbi:MAG: hypothetical protein E6H06_12555 [Bacteroidetes bacterium]|nr:MAG: hypothetical protein E6H06_12555 [Bacteroidota bacterium]